MSESQDWKLEGASAFHEQEFGLQDLIDTLLQYYWLVLSLFFLFAFFGGGYAFLATAWYRADSLIQIEEKKGSTLGGLQQIATALDVGQSPVQGEIQIVKSREVILKAITATRANIQAYVENRFPVIGAWFANRHDRTSTELSAPLFGLSTFAWGGERLSVDQFDVPPAHFSKKFALTIIDAESWRLAFPDGTPIAVGKVGELVELNFSGAQEGRIRIAAVTARPGTTFSLFNVGLVRAYGEVLRNLKVVETSRQSGIIRITFEDEDPDFTVRVVNEIARAYLQQNVYRRSEEAQQSLLFLEKLLPELKAKTEGLEQELNLFRTRTGTVNVEKQTDSLLQRSVGLEKERQELDLKRQQLAQRYRPDYPEFKAIEASLSKMSAEQGRLSAQINRLPAAQKDLLRLQRDVQVNTQLYTALLNSAQELKVAKAGTIGNVRVVDYAIAGTEPVRPQRLFILTASMAVGLFVGVLSAFVARSIRPAVRSTEQVERQTGLAAYGTIPESALQKRLLPKRWAPQHPSARLLAQVEPSDTAVEALRSVRTGLSFALLDAKDKNIAITGATAGLGKSFITANLAAVLAQAGKRTLVIETDLRRPKLDIYFGLTKGMGLSDVLSGEEFDVACRKNVVPNLDVLLAGTVPPNPAELLMAPRFQSLLKDLENRYEYLIVDCAPVLPVADTLAVVPHCASTFLVVRAEETTCDEIREAARRITSSGGNVKGVLFNGVKRRRVAYSYYKYQYGPS